MKSLRARPEEWLADEFGGYAQRWAEEQGASSGVAETVRRTAAALSRATSAGHVCVELRDVVTGLNVEAGPALTLAELRSSLCESRLVGSAAEPGVMPFVLDGDDRLYLHRYFDYESRLARSVALRCGPMAAALPGGDLPAQVATLLETLFLNTAEAPEFVPDWQKIAVVMALLGRLTVISGGPGTGKTTAIVNLLACLLEQDAACRIALAAPTGKAAARITETIRGRATHLPQRIKALLPQKSFTVHRLLGLLPRGGFLHHAGNPLPIDVLIVDEASMLDLALATQLFEAVPPEARIILVGDKDQLAAVESGAVFAELSTDPRMRRSRVMQMARICSVPPDAIQMPQPDPVKGLADSVVWLKHNYRFGNDSAIGRLASAINAGDSADALARLREAKSPPLRWIDAAALVPSPLVSDALCAGYSPYIDACRTSAFDPEAVSEAFGRARVLCAVRDGPRGTTATNECISAHFRRALAGPLNPPGRSEWYPGRPVMVLRNDYTLRLFNGDIGITLPAGDELMVYFLDAESGLRAVAPLRLPEHETAFAMTVHKAQGSEFDDVSLLLPAEPNQILTRELLYTAVTRARRQVTLVASAGVLEHAIRSATVRVSGLSARLRQAHSAD